MWTEVERINEQGKRDFLWGWIHERMHLMFESVIATVLPVKNVLMDGGF